MQTKLSRLVPGLLACLLLVGILPGCADESPPAPRGERQNFPDQILSEFAVDMTRGDLKGAEIMAQKGVVYRKRDSMILSGMTARLFDSKGEYSSTLTADSGLLRERRELMIAHGTVRIESRDSLLLDSDTVFWYGELTTGAIPAPRAGATKDRYMVAKGRVHLITRDSVHLWTDTLLWNDIDRRVATDAFVTIVRSHADTLRGYGLRSDDQLERITIQKRVSGRIQDQSR